MRPIVVALGLAAAAAYPVAIQAGDVTDAVSEGVVSGMPEAETATTAPARGASPDAWGLPAFPAHPLWLIDGIAFLNSLSVRHQNVEVDGAPVSSSVELWTLDATWTPRLRAYARDNSDAYAEAGVQMGYEFGGEASVRPLIAIVYNGLRLDSDDRVSGIYAAIGTLRERPVLRPLHDDHDADGYLEMADLQWLPKPWLQMDIQFGRLSVVSTKSLEAFYATASAAADLELFGIQFGARVDHQSGFDTKGLEFKRPAIPAGQVSYLGGGVWAGPRWLRLEATNFFGAGSYSGVMEGRRYQPGFDPSGRLLRIDVLGTRRTRKVEFQVSGGLDQVDGRFEPAMGEPHLREYLVERSEVGELINAPLRNFVRSDLRLIWLPMAQMGVELLVRQTALLDALGSEVASQIQWMNVSRVRVRWEF